MSCINLQRTARFLVCCLCLVLGAVRVAVAQESSLYNVFDDLSSAGSLAQFPEVRDVQLRRTYMALVSMFSDASREAAERYGVSELRMLSNDLDSHVRDVNDNTNKPDRLELKRSPAPGSSNNENAGTESIIAKLMSGLPPIAPSPHATEEQATDPTSTNHQTDLATDRPATLGKRLLGGIGKLFGGKDGDGEEGNAIKEAMSSAAGNIFDKLLTKTGSGLAGAGFFGGVGIGQGAAQALNFTTAQKSKSTGEQIAELNGMKNTGLNPIIQSAAMGLTATALKAVVGSQALQIPPLAAIAASLGAGVGNGGAMGLGLTNRNLSPPLNGSGLVDSVGALGFGATQALASNLNVSGGLASLLPANGLDVGSLALGAGSGIGAGAARGLKLNAAAAPPRPESNADIPGIAGTFAFGLSRALTDSLNVSTDSLAAMLPPIDFNSAALSVGDGLGSGAALGLKLTQNDTSGFGTPSPPSAPSLQDIPRIAGNLAFGLSKSLAGSVNTSGVSVESLIPPDLDVGGIVLGAGRGLGGGASVGLGLANVAKNLSARAESNPLADVAGLVEKFTFGLGNSFTDKIDVASQAKNLASGLPSVDLGATASSVGSGLGLGLAKGLDLSTKAIVPPPLPKSLKDLPQLAGTFMFGLSDALAGQLNLSGITSELTKNAGGLVAKFAVPAASGLGKGIGTGTAVGLGLQPEAGPVSLRDPPETGGLDIEGLTQSFSEALTSRFLANDTAGELIKRVSGRNTTEGINALLSSVDFPRVTGGLARGLLTGAGDGVEALGGIGAIVNGTSSAPTGPIPETKIDFDDSTSGAAVGLGQGLGSSGVVTLQRLLSRGFSASPSNPQRRDLAVLGRRQNDDAPPPVDLSRFADSTALSTIGQTGIDALTCDGVAGAFLVLLGLQKSGTVSGGSPSKDTLETVKTLIPKGTIRVQSQGNTFAIDGTKLAENLGGPTTGLLSTVSINGFPAITFAVFLVLHIGSAIIGLYVIWPLILAFGSLQNMAARFHIPVRLSQWTAKRSKFFRMFVLGPSLLLILVFGVLAGAATGHFRTAHGILSIFTLIFAIASLVLSFFTKPAELTPGDPVALTVKLDAVAWASHACNQILLALLLPTAVTGFTDLSSVTLCLTRAVVPFELAVSLGMSLVTVYMLGSYVSVLELFLIFMAKKAARKQTLTQVEKAVDAPTRPENQWPAARRPAVAPVVPLKDEDREQVDGKELREFYI